MSRISEVFKNKKVFIPFLTAGDPDLTTTKKCIKKMCEAGAGIIEIGIPFSDPIAEGTVIQGANVRALSGNAFLPDIFATVKELRKTISTPIVFLTYVNPVFNYGYENFFEACKTCGIDGIIIPDVPFEEKSEIVSFADKYDVDFITLIAPTSDERIKQIAKDAKGYVYVVSSHGVTGIRSEITTNVDAIIKKVREVTSTPISVGFGINTPEQAKYFSEIADGVIVGSAIVKIIEKYGINSPDKVFDYVKTMVNAIEG